VGAEEAMRNALDGDCAITGHQRDGPDGHQAI
jgi:hypothetical protein